MASNKTLGSSGAYSTSSRTVGLNWCSSSVRHHRRISSVNCSLNAAASQDIAPFFLVLPPPWSSCCRIWPYAAAYLGLSGGQSQLGELYSTEYQLVNQSLDLLGRHIHLVQMGKQRLNVFVLRFCVFSLPAFFPTDLRPLPLERFLL